MCLPRSRSTLAITLAAVITVGTKPALAASPKPVPSSGSVPVDRAALLVSRFSFGARPGELAAVRALGAETWFEQQLAPERIADTALDLRLMQYPALRMTQAQRIARYPTPNEIRQIAKTGALPQDADVRTIVADQVEFYQERQKAKPGAPVGGMALDGAAPIVRRDRNGAEVAVTPALTKPSMAAQVTPTAAAPELNLEQSTAPLPQTQIDGLLATPAAERYAEVMRLPVEQLIALRKGLKGREDKLVDGMTPLQRETLTALAGTNRMVTGELLGARLLTDIYSDRELQAVMTDFWLNHFNIYLKKDGQMPSLLPEFQQTVQAHALGRFEDLLVATARSPAMLLYLDNAQSVGPDSPAAGNPHGAKKKSVGLNENYARELMELHTLGVNGGYNQQDVTEVAKVFTGWTTDKPADGGAFTFNERRHEPGSKTVLGRSIPEGGEKEGETVLHLLATSPATAHFLSLELAERFVSDTPPPALVDRMARAYLASDGDMRTVLRAMVHAPEFFSPATVHAKLKTPLEYVVSAARATGAEVQNPQPLAQALERLGMPLYGCQPPTGYKWDAETWLSSSALVNRMNFSLLLSGNRIAGTAISLPPLLGEAAAQGASEKERALEAAVLHTAASAQTRDAVLAQADSGAVQQAPRDVAATTPAGGKTAGGTRAVPVRANVLGQAPAAMASPPADKQASAMLGLLLGSPEFQRR